MAAQKKKQRGRPTVEQPLRTRQNVRLEDDDFERVRELAAEADRSISNMLRLLIKRGLRAIDEENAG